LTITATQRAERVGYLGASDAAAVLGLSRWGTPLGVWTEKTGAVATEEREENLAMEVGDELEAAVGRLFTKRTGHKIRRVNRTLVHPEHQFIRANLDYEVIGTGEPVECKTATAFKAKEWEGEEIPQEYVIQVLHQMACAPRAPGAWIAVLIGGNVDFVYRRVPRDKDVIAQIVEREVRFWNEHVIPKKRPQAIHKNDADVLHRLFPAGDDGREPAILGDEADAILDLLEAQRQDLSALKGSIVQAENVLRSMLGDKSVGITARFRVSWWRENQRHVDLKKLKKEMPEVYDRYAADTPRQVLRYRKRMARYQS
jgi:putative phage-type endonuclease